MKIFRHAIEGVLLFTAAWMLQNALTEAGIDERHVGLWVNSMIVVAGVCIIWFERRSGRQ